MAIQFLDFVFERDGAVGQAVAYAAKAASAKVAEPHTEEEYAAHGLEFVTAFHHYMKRAHVSYVPAARI